MHPVMFAQDTLWSAQTASCLWYSYTLPGESVPREQTFSATRGSVTKKDVNGTQQTDLLPLGYVQGQRVTVWYNPEDPTNSASLSSDDWRIVGGVLIIIGILFLGASWGYFYITNHFKPMAALQGGSTIASAMISPFQHRNTGWML